MMKRKRMLTLLTAADIDGNGEISVEDPQWILKYYTQKYVAGKDITWDDIFVKKAQTLPQFTAIVCCITATILPSCSV